MAMRRLLTFVFLSVFAAVAAHAQSVRWENGDSGDPSDIQLVFQDCSPDGDPQIPRIDGVTLTLSGSSSQTTMNNFTVSRATILLYHARTRGSAAIKIPAFSVQTNKGALTVPAFTGGVPRSATDANVLSHLETGSPTVWAGEVFPLNYVLDVSRRSFNQLGTGIEWNPAPLVVEEWSKFEPSEVTSGGEARLRISSKARAYVKTPGPITLNAANQLVNLTSGSIGFGLFQTPRIEQLSVTSDRPSIVVRPLPSPAPAGFNGAVGQFKLNSKIVPTSAAVGEPVTWTIELSGTGNWPDIPGLPQRDVSKDFNVVQPQAKRTPAEGKLFDATLSEDVVLVPTRAGEYTLGPVDFVYFDPATKTYKTVSAPRTTVTIAPPAVTSSTATPAPNAAGNGLSPTQDKGPKPEVKAPAQPQGIPRDPLAGSSVAFIPMRTRVFALLLAAPFGLLAVFWGFLAVTRARQTDPVRPQREARERLRATIAQLRSSQSSSRADSSLLLLKWQHDAAILWQLPQAAPHPTALPDPAWATLWSEADRALYSATATLPADWAQRAEAALNAKRVSGFRIYTAFYPRNLLPFVASIALAVILTPLALAQSANTSSSDPAAAYRRGDFAAAEQSWRETIAAKPTDAIARHNLSLALAQQDRWPEAAAHAAAAFVQDPANLPLRWQLGLASEKATFIPAPLVGFIPPGPLQSLARLASPGRWQLAAILASALAAVACGALLLGIYRNPSRLRTWTASTALLAAVLLAISAAVGLRAYGSTVDRRAVIAWRTTTLRSIPTEADTTQKTTPLAAGSVGIEEKTFLGWVRLRFENGQTGWVRKEELVGIWK